MDDWENVDAQNDSEDERMYKTSMPLYLTRISLLNLMISQRPKLRRARSSPKRRQKASLRRRQRPRSVHIVQPCRRSRRMPSCRGSWTSGMLIRLWQLPRRALDRESGSPPQVIVMMIALPLLLLGHPRVEWLRSHAVLITVIETHSRTLPRMDPLRMDLMSGAIYPRTTT